jgi:hypothetical protein
MSSAASSEESIDLNFSNADEIIQSAEDAVAVEISRLLVSLTSSVGMLIVSLLAPQPGDLSAWLSLSKIYLRAIP